MDKINSNTIVKTTIMNHPPSLGPKTYAQALMGVPKNSTRTNPIIDSKAVQHFFLMSFKGGEEQKTAYRIERLKPQTRTPPLRQ